MRQEHRAKRLSWCLSLLMAFSVTVAQVCALPGNDGSPNISGTVNTYWRPNTTNATYNSTTTSIPLTGKTGATNDIASGDLVLIIQMQCANITTTNSNAYGDGVSETGDGTASGFTDPSSSCLAGRYEFVRAGPSSTATTLDLTNSPLRNIYVQANATNTVGRRTMQIIRVPQYLNATLSGAITAPAWNGFTGGIVVLDVANTLNLNSQSINVDGLGFRGGGGRNRSANDATTRYRWDDDTRHASKGEGIVGTPRYVSNKTSPDNGNTATITDNGSTWGGYPTGSASTGDYARGAPGNAGGGGAFWDGSSDNGGGAGGGNGGAGGRGGAGWRSGGYSGVSADYSNLAEKKWGFGGSSFSASVSRVVMGGGGGAGDNNNNSTDVESSGANGGGIIMVRATTLSGSGTLSARGARAATNSSNDGAGGGGAGGSVVVLAEAWTSGSVTITVQGGRGGDTYLSGTTAHGTGGGGGGGVVIRSGGTAPTRTGGSPGNTNTGDSPPGGATHGAQAGGTGIDTTIAVSADTPGANTGYSCVNLGVAKELDRIIHSNNAADNLYTLVYRLTAENFGTTTLNNLELYDDVVTQFSGLSPTNFNTWVIANSGSLSPTPTFTVSSSWNGTASSNLLTAGQTLTAGQSKLVYVSFDVTVNPAAASPNNRLRDNSASTRGTNPASVVISDISANGIDPDGTDNDNVPDENSVTPTPFVKLVKEVRNCGPSLSSCTGTYATTATGKPGDYLEYRVRYYNLSSQAITTLRVSDTLVSATPFQEDTYGLLTPSGIGDFSLTCPNASVVDIDRSNAAVTTTPASGAITAFSINLGAGSACNASSITPGQQGFVLFKVKIP
jgi:uncharacterized repeat protein (TIGR01451 family)